MIAAWAVALGTDELFIGYSHIFQSHDNVSEHGEVQINVVHVFGMDCQRTM